MPAPFDAAVVLAKVVLHAADKLGVRASLLAGPRSPASARLPSRA
jgi:hypothetical protein